MPVQGVTINGQLISWAMIQKVRTLCGGDWDTTLDCFWKARKATGPNAVIRYIHKGFIKNEKGVMYSLVPSKEREAGQMDGIRKWWQSEVCPPSTKAPTKLKEELRNYFQSLADAFA